MINLSSKNLLSKELPYLLIENQKERKKYRLKRFKGNFKVRSFKPLFAHWVELIILVGF